MQPLNRERGPRPCPEEKRSTVFIGHPHAWAHGCEYIEPIYCWVGTSFLLVPLSGERSV